MKLAIEVNQRSVKDNAPLRAPTGGAVFVTPSIDEDYWIARVPVSDSQAVVCFPKFGTIGIGFQHEEDWNTNLPFSCETSKIYDHIKRNKGDGPQTSDCLEAIRVLQDYAKTLKA